MAVVPNMFMSGPPGPGRTLIAKSLLGILPSMPVEEALEVTKFYSIAGLVGGGAWPGAPWRALSRRATEVRSEPDRNPDRLMNQQA